MEPKWHRHHQHGIIRLWYVCVRAHALRRPVGSTVKRAFGCLLLTIAEALLSPFRRVFWRWWRRNMEPKRPHHDHSIIRLRYMPGRACASACEGPLREADKAACHLPSCWTLRASPPPLLPFRRVFCWWWQRRNVVPIRRRQHHHLGQPFLRHVLPHAAPCSAQRHIPPPAITCLIIVDM